MTITEIRKALNVPRDLRISQYIYNIFRDYEQEMDLMVKHDGKFFERTAGV